MGTKRVEHWLRSLRGAAYHPPTHRERRLLPRAHMPADAAVMARQLAMLQACEGRRTRG